jgi:hypothetical protein
LASRYLGLNPAGGPDRTVPVARKPAVNITTGTTVEKPAAEDKIPNPSPVRMEPRELEPKQLGRPECRAPSASTTSSLVSAGNTVLSLIERSRPRPQKASRRPACPMMIGAKTMISRAARVDIRAANQDCFF